MKIFYAIQATGNGHISRARQLLPWLSKYGEVDFFLSGDNWNLDPGIPVRFRSKGLSLYYNNNGGLDYLKIARAFQPMRLKREIRDLPVEKYDLVINDFDYITAAACARKKIPSVGWSHQASFQSALTPRTSGKHWIGEYILKNFARATSYVGLHFKKYDDFIFTPVIKQQIREAEPQNLGHITVYLPAWPEWLILLVFRAIKHVPFQIFSREAKMVKHFGHITIFPIQSDVFNKSFITCQGIITGGGFETPAEALHMGKKIMTVPIPGQYEQACNAAALRDWGIPVASLRNTGLTVSLEEWLNAPAPAPADFPCVIKDCIDYIMSLRMKKTDIQNQPIPSLLLPAALSKDFTVS